MRDEHDSFDEQDKSSRRGSASGLGDLFDRIRNDEKVLRDQLDRNARALAQSALSKLDVVSRSEFDAQAAVLQRTRARVQELEAELERLTELVDRHLN